MRRTLRGPPDCRPVRVDALDRASLDRALEDVDLCIAAAGTSQDATTAVRAAMAAGADYLDIQVSPTKADRLLDMDSEARAAGMTVVTDGGFHPGVPAAMVRYADQRLGGIERARVASVIAVDWAALRPIADSTVAEMMEEFRDFSYEEYRSGRWESASKLPTFTFPAPFGRRKAAAMGLTEMHQLTAALPGLRETGFYVGGFNPVVDYAMIPVAMAGMRIAPDLLGPPLGRLLHWGLIRIQPPPVRHGAATRWQRPRAAADDPDADQPPRRLPGHGRADRGRRPTDPRRHPPQTRRAHPGDVRRADPVLRRPVRHGHQRGVASGRSGANLTAARCRSSKRLGRRFPA